MTPHQRKTIASVSSLLAWYPQHARDLPWRRTRDPYAVWVSEIMLQQTQVKTVLAYWQRWMKALPAVQALATANPEKLHKLWEGLGYYTRVRNMYRAAQIIVSQHHGRFPQRFEDVIALPGIGRYTAGAICSIAFDQPKPILDGNVIRVLSRLFSIDGDPRAKPANDRLWQLAEELVLAAARTQPVSGASRLNQSLMELGALICTPRQPQCGLCPVAQRCLARRQDRVHELPGAARRVPPTARRFVAFVAQRRNRFLVQQRPAGVVNAFLWEFPNAELSGTAQAQDAARKLFGTRRSVLTPLCVLKHSITRYRLTLEVFRVAANQIRKPSNPDAKWLTLTQLHRLPFASAHKKILGRLSGALVDVDPGLPLVRRGLQA